MNKFDRIISILIILQTRRVVKASALAEKFEVSLRTVYRDIRTLTVAGVPITGEPGMGYSLVKGYRLPPVMFEQGEAHALLAASKVVASMTDESVNTRYQSAMDKIRAVLRTDDKDALEQLDDAIIFTPRRKAENELLAPIMQAIADNVVIQISYQKVNEEDSNSRKIEPVGCYFSWNNWYLIAWCRLREDYRTFKMSRIRSLHVSDEQINRAHITLQEYISKEAQRVQSIKVVVEFDKELVEYTRNGRYSFGFVGEEVLDSGVRLTFIAPELYGISNWLLSYTDRVKVIEPQSLKDLLVKQTKRLVAHYL